MKVSDLNHSTTEAVYKPTKDRSSTRTTVTTPVSNIIRNTGSTRSMRKRRQLTIEQILDLPLVGQFKGSKTSTNSRYLICPQWASLYTSGNIIRNTGFIHRMQKRRELTLVRILDLPLMGLFEVSQTSTNTRSTRSGLMPDK